MAIKVDPELIRNPPKEVGSGTHQDPLIMFICVLPKESKFPGRIEAIEKVCRHACWYTGNTVCYIRSVDKTGTTAYDPRVSRKERDPADDDRHITVYMSNVRGEFKYEGHVYVVRDGPNRKVPNRLTYPEERKTPVGGPSPKLHEPGSSIALTFPTTLWTFYHSPQFVYLSGLAQR
ncbi:hypothetical protein CB0940_09427 [Cercospora beticola]|uniref:Uncharacterized protein n=1 Tax=Cercospora beticola TaxID=122368 RepID=A0A2G5HHK5_CERBT|nr:hypothetical protein CB0940_09427 [Cercospora beticola]PIA91693.1 hypothetical protein CB0940_09427 [Cercospora beticola]WPB06257.1 hypothetical protein RHO25_010914 [Cercospora beticola]